MAARRTTAKGQQQQDQRALQARVNAMDSARALFGRYEDKLSKVLPKVIPAKRLIETALTECAREPQLLQCTQSSLVGSLIQAGQLGLVPGLMGECWLLPFRNTKQNCIEAQLIVGYRGLLKLAYQSGQVSSVQACVVRQGDEFDYRYGTAGFLHHKPDDEASDDRRLTHAYAIMWLRGADHSIWEVLNRQKVLRARDSSPAARAGNSPWKTHEDEMFMKTALRHTSKRAPSSIEQMAIAAALDERIEARVSQQLRAFAPELPDLPPAGYYDIPPADTGDDEGGTDEGTEPDGNEEEAAAPVAG